MTQLIKEASTPNYKAGEWIRMSDPNCEGCYFGNCCFCDRALYMGDLVVDYHELTCQDPQNCECDMVACDGCVHEIVASNKASEVAI